MKYFVTFLLFSFLLVIDVLAEIRLPSLLGDNMVLQQQSQIRLWGKGTPFSLIKLHVSWMKEERKTNVNANGDWEFVITTPSASFNKQTICLVDRDSVILHNLLIGEVWLCAGQSNMVMPLSGFDNCPVRDANNIIADAFNHEDIRMITIKPQKSLVLKDDVEGVWQLPTTKNAAMFSAVAYHYALALHRTLQVPIGIILCAWGGSRVEGWLPKEIVQTYKDEDLTLLGDNKVPIYLKPTLMYNAMLFPCRKYAIKGFIWYQGESNVKNSDTYAERLSTMVTCWRSLWGKNQLPFYFVEIAPFACEYKQSGIIGALLREAQFKAQSMIPRSGMICTNDLVEYYEAPQVHPCNKKDIGERLAYMALNKTYQYTAINSDYPSYHSMNVLEGKIEISFNHAEKGLSPWINMKGFEIAGKDKVFFSAEASLNTRRHVIVVYSKDVQRPVAVRYCFRNFLKGNVVNTRNLPLIPFRTDDW